MDNPLTVKKQMSMDFIYDLLLLAFLGRGDADVCHSLLCFLFLDRTQRSMFRHLQPLSSRNFCPFGSVPEDEETRPSVRLSSFWEQTLHTIFSWLSPLLKSDGPWCGSNLTH